LLVVLVTVAAVLASWMVMVIMVEVGSISQPAADAERYGCMCWLAGRSDWYQCSLDWGLSSSL